MVIGYPFRTQFYAAPAQAALLACALGAAGALLPRRLGACAVAAGVGWLLVWTTACAWHAQERAHDESVVCFEKAAHALGQAHAISPRYAEDTLVLFVVASLDASPFGCGYALNFAALGVLGHEILEVDSLGASPDKVTFTDRGVQTTGGGLGGKNLSLLRQGSGLPPDGARGTQPVAQVAPLAVAASYAPLERMRPGPITPLEWFRWHLWVTPPSDVLDVRSGILFGGGWSRLEYLEGRLSRWADDGAEVVVNPAGQREQLLNLTIGDGAVYPPRVLEALDRGGRPVAACPVPESGNVRLVLPLDPERVNLFRLRLRQRGAAERNFRVVRTDVLVRPRKYQPPRPDIVGSGMMLGRNWHPLERGPDHLPFRWVENHAELQLLDLSGSRGVFLEVEPGFGMDGQPCSLTVADQAGRVLVRATVASRQQVYIPLSRGDRVETLQLSVTGGGKRIPSDPRIMNFRVFLADPAYTTPSKDPRQTVAK